MQVKVTGSAIYDALGFGTFKSQLEHFDHVMFSKPKPEHSAEISEKMRHGTDKFLPVFHENISFFEEGCYKITTTNDVCMIVSHDGSSRESVYMPAVFGVECKCPYPGNLYATPVPYSIPKYYIPQILAGMRCLKVDHLYYVSYSKEPQQSRKQHLTCTFGKTVR